MQASWRKSIPLTLLILFSTGPVGLYAQFEVEIKSIHQIESEQHRYDPVDSTLERMISTPRSFVAVKPDTLSRKVFGWHPYWASSTAHEVYDYSVLSHIGYFSYEVDTATGGYTTVRNWMTTPIIDYAHARGVKVVLTVTNFGYTENDKLLSDTNKQNTLINNLISLLKSRNGDGVNFDIEMVRGTQKTNLVSFMRKAATRIKDSIPGAEISMAGPAVDWSNGWDYAQLGQICDYIIFMGYNYYYSGSSTAGPVAPISGSGYTIAWTITDYLNKSVPAKKVWAGFPLYGYDWPVKSSARMDSAIAKGSSRTYTVIKSQYIDTIPAGNKFFDATYNVPWYRYTVGTTWRQTWYDDSLSLVKKYQLVNQRNLGGIGFWALSYQGSGTEIWTGVSSSFPLVHAAEVAQLPSDFAIGQNFPNPFNGETNIEVKVKIEAKIEVVVYDLLGREVATIVNEKMNPGVQRIQWNAGNLPSGVYIYRARDGEISDVKKMIVLR